MLLRWAVIMGCVSTEPGKNASALNWRPNPTGRMAKKKTSFQWENAICQNPVKNATQKRAAWLENIYYFLKCKLPFSVIFKF